MALSQYFDLGMGLKGYEEEGSRDVGGEIWGDTLRMFCMTYLFYPCRLSTVSMEVERGEGRVYRKEETSVWKRGRQQESN